SPAPTAWQARIEQRLRALEHARGVVVPEAPPATAHDAMRSKLASLTKTLAGAADVGIAVKDLRTGAVVFEHGAEQTLNPASNHKLLTATAAVTLLGDDFRFETRVVRDGDTLYLVGGGDPSLQVEDLEALARDVDTNGITALVIDDTMFSARTFGPGYEDGGPGFSYMAPSGALSLQYNTVVVRTGPGGISVTPPSEHLSLERGRTRGPVHVSTRADGEPTIVRVDGSTTTPSKTRRRITDPGRFTASTFARFAGLDVQIRRGRAPRDATLVARHESAVLPEVLGSALKFSNNFTTEQVLRTLGHLASNAPGDWQNGSAVLRRFWDAVGQDPAALSFENASGLSADGRVTPRALVALVSLWTEHEDAAAVMDALPVAGREGTLAGRLRRSRGRVRAKTGTLSNATGLTGVITDHRGDPQYAFSVLVGSRQVGRAKRFQDRVVMTLLRG
ncbi:MAG: D-alanyl-D-alanine carboxypeptidase, partial [Myxococcota bacterium]